MICAPVQVRGHAVELALKRNVALLSPAMRKCRKGFLRELRGVKSQSALGGISIDAPAHQ